MELDGESFVTGSSRYLDSYGGREDPRIFVQFTTHGPDAIFMAMLDTGAQWTVLESDVLPRDAEPLEERTLLTRLGRFTGHLYRIPLTLLADRGDSLEIESTVFAAEDWTAGNFLGYVCTLDRVRFAVDPDRNLFFFGGAGSPAD